jgi:hypothetical protein
MFVRPLLLSGAAGLIALLVVTVSCHHRPPSGSYEGIPPGFDFPANDGALDKLIEGRKYHLLRRHAWLVFAGMTQPAEQQDPLFPARQPSRWETWYLRQDTFAAAPPSARVPFLLGLQPPGELAGQDRQATGASNTFLENNNVLFNQEAFDRIRSGRQPLYLRSTLDALCGSSNHDKVCRTGVQDIDAFPRPAIAVKAFFLAAPQGVCTPIGSWDFQRPIAGDVDDQQPTWPRQVFVENGSGSCDDQKKQGYSVVPLKDVYSIPVPSASEKSRNGLLAITRLQDIDRAFPGAKEGDQLVLLGMHVATREIANWVWATFWWHDRPEEGPFSEDRPPEVEGVWRHYLMNASYDMDVPRETDGTPHIAYNPYLEGFIKDGVLSNCMTCHRRATWPPQDRPHVIVSDGSAYDPLLGQTIVRGSDAAEATYLSVPFEKLLKTSFIWSIPVCAVQPLGTCQ